MLLCDSKSSSKVSGSYTELLGIHKYLIINLNNKHCMYVFTLNPSIKYYNGIYTPSRVLFWPSSRNFRVIELKLCIFHNLHTPN